MKQQFSKDKYITNDKSRLKSYLENQDADKFARSRKEKFNISGDHNLKFSDSSKSMNDVKSAVMRKFFRKCFENDFVFKDINDAKRFSMSLQAFDQKSEAFHLLTSNKSIGFKRISEVMSYCNSTQTLNSLLLPFLEFLFDTSICVPLYESNREDFLLSLFAMPNFNGFSFACLD
jgi:hypothetical protein